MSTRPQRRLRAGPVTRRKKPRSRPATKHVSAAMTRMPDSRRPRAPRATRPRRQRLTVHCPEDARPAIDRTGRRVSRRRPRARRATRVPACPRCTRLPATLRARAAMRRPTRTPRPTARCAPEPATPTSAIISPEPCAARGATCSGTEPGSDQRFDSMTPSMCSPRPLVVMDGVPLASSETSEPWQSPRLQSVDGVCCDGGMP